MKAKSTERKFAMLQNSIRMPKNKKSQEVTENAYLTECIILFLYAIYTMINKEVNKDFQYKLIPGSIEVTDILRSTRRCKL